MVLVILAASVAIWLPALSVALAAPIASAFTVIGLVAVCVTFPAESSSSTLVLVGAENAASKVMLPAVLSPITSSGVVIALAPAVAITRPAVPVPTVIAVPSVSGSSVTIVGLTMAPPSRMVSARIMMSLSAFTVTLLPLTSMAAAVNASVASLETVELASTFSVLPAVAVSAPCDVTLPSVRPPTAASFVMPPLVTEWSVASAPAVTVTLPFFACSDCATSVESVVSTSPVLPEKLPTVSGSAAP